MSYIGNMEKTIFLDLPSSILNLWRVMNCEYETRLVGGAVRDMVLGAKPKDYDFCTVATPDQMITFAEEYGYRIEPTGLQHGTISFILDDEAYEFTTLRIDTDCDGRHAEVEFTTDFKADAGRRDFTINAMSADVRGRIYDYFGGLKDLIGTSIVDDDVQIRFVGNAEDRIREDYLRVLRFFRFAARFDAGMDWSALKFMCTNEVHEGLKKISRERIWAEISKLAVAPAREAAITQMILTGVFDAIGMEHNPMAQVCRFNAKDAPTFMAGYCGLDPVGFGKAWKMSTDEINKMAHVAWSGPSWGVREMVSDILDDTKADWVRACAHVWLPGVDDGDFAAIYISVPKFMVTGKDLMAEGFAPGPEMGQELKRRRAEWKRRHMEGL